MDFIEAFIEKGRDKGEFLELENTRSTALGAFVAEMTNIVDVFNLALAADEGFQLQTLPVAEGKTGLWLRVPQEGSAIADIYIDVGFSPETMSYSVVERGIGAPVACDEDTMKMQVAEIVLLHIPNLQFLKFYRALQEENQAPRPAAPAPVATPHVLRSVPTYPLQETPQEAAQPQAQPAPASIAEAAENIVRPFPVPPAAPEQDISEESVFDDDGDPLWEDDEDEAQGSGDSSLDKHLSTDVVMR